MMVVLAGFIAMRELIADTSTRGAQRSQGKGAHVRGHVEVMRGCDKPISGDIRRI